MLKRLFSFSNFTLLVALTLSTIAAWYSIIGLTAIFAGAVIPIIIMGSALELAKITSTVWLRKYWRKAGWWLKIYLVPAVIALALLTSMGIFGFLSKAHIDQGVPTGDIAAKVSIIDEKIKTQRENIELARKALTQMDAQVDQRLSRGDSESGAERAVQIRRQQATERGKLQKDISEAQKEITKLNEERAPIASELRKVEAEVGPIKYIAALIYGDNPDQNILERAVRWVIILLVLVFDPLALVLVLAANQSREWDAEVTGEVEPVAPVPDPAPETTSETIEAIPQEPIVEEPVQAITESPIPPTDDFDLSKHAYLKDPWISPDLAPIVATPEPESKLEETTPEPQPLTPVATVDQPRPEPEKMQKKEIGYEEHPGGYVTFKGVHMHKDALKGMHPELFTNVLSNARPVQTSFGTQFPAQAADGDMFVRVDMLPNKVYKFDGYRWIEVNKTLTDTYLHDQEYIKYLIDKIQSGEYDIELLSEQERIQIEEYLQQK